MKKYMKYGAALVCAVSLWGTNVITYAATRTATQNQAIVYTGYKECNKVPDFGNMFGTDGKTDKSSKGNIVSLTYSYSDAGISSSKGVKEYSKALEDSGFTLAKKSGQGDATVYSYYNSDKSILVNFSVTEIGNRTIALVNVQYNKKLVSTNYSSTTYSEFPTVPDFGSLSGAVLEQKLSTDGKTYMYCYVPGTFKGEAIKEYDAELIKNGFYVIDVSKENQIVYRKGNIVVGMLSDDEYGTFDIIVMEATK